MKTWKESLQAIGLKAALGYLNGDPEKNLPKLIDFVEMIDKDQFYKNTYRMAREIIQDPDNNWNIMLKSVFNDLDVNVRKKLFENFIVHSAVIGNHRRGVAMEEYNCNIPWAILMDPTSACNLHCTGCWAAEYGDRLNLSFETMDSIVSQAKELGVFMFLFSGGEPLVKKKEIIKLCEKHSDCVFLSFTNGTLIDEAFADEMLRVCNFIPAFSIEGFEADTDFRRGEGTYQAVIKAMKILKERKLPFGISCCYTSKNAEIIGSEEYIDFMIEMGAKFAWIFTYIPVGTDAVPELIATADQRAYMYRQVRKFRDTKPIFLMDFWNDGEYVGGCIAGGRCYLHVNANGDAEPCAFIHYSDTNLKEKTLLEALQGPLFMEYHKNQPFNENGLRPCPLLDNNGKLAEMVHRSGAKSTDFTNPEDVDQLCGKCKYAAEHWKPVADELWENSPKGKAAKAAKEAGETAK